MAVQISDGAGTPHATDYSNLLALLKTFALANGWTSLEDTADKLVLQGEGLGGTDEINIAFQKYANAGSGAYGWRLNGYSSYVGTGSNFLGQPGAIQTTQISGGGYPSLPLWNSTIPYWFIGNERRLIVIAKVGTTYQMAYLGFFLPFASPSQYPYPLAIGGSFINSAGNTEGHYAGASGATCAFWTALSNSTSISSMMSRLPGGSWYSVANSSSEGAQNSFGMFPYNQADNVYMRDAVDGSAILTPIEIHQSSTSPVSHHRLGELDGVYHVSGFSQSAENIITIGGDDHLVVPNIFRSGVEDFAAIKLV